MALRAGARSTEVRADGNGMGTTSLEVLYQEVAVTTAALLA